MKRPFGISFLALIVVFTGVVHGLRLCEAVFFWRILKEYGADPLYISISGGFWLMAAGFLAQGIWQGKTWTRTGIIAGMIIYGSWYWVDRLAFQVFHANWPFALGFTVLLAGLFIIVFLSPKTQAYFINKGSRHE